MKYLLLLALTLVVVCQVVHSAPSTDDEEIDELLTELTETLLKRKLQRIEEREHDSHKREMVEKARKLTEAGIEVQRRKSAVKGVNHQKGKIRKFLSTNARIREVSLAARTQLNVIHAYKREWQMKRGAHESDFWQELDEEFNGHILDARTIVPTLTKVPAGAEVCPITPPTCTDTHERSYDGTCNNLQNPLWGGANRAQARLLPANYSDDVEKPRVTSSGNALPSARLIANEVAEIRDRINTRHTYMSMQFGQFLDHDITHTPEFVLTNAAGEIVDIDCSTNNCGGDPSYCYGINITAGDPMFTPGECLNFIRSAPFLRDNCPIGPRVPANSISAYLDMSNVYSSSETERNQLVDATTGKMILVSHPDDASANPKKNLLPTVSNAESQCSATKATYKCNHAGDVRANEQVGLTAMHTVYARKHNHIVDKLSAQDPTLTAAEKFKLARKILTGLWQHMVYKDYLPVILGGQVMAKYELNPGRANDGLISDYEQNVSADMFVEFTTAAFRFGHTEIKDMMTFNNYLRNDVEHVDLSSLQFNPTNLFHSPVASMEKHGIESVLLGLLSVPVGGWDRFFAGQVRNHLFADNPPHGLGTDLVARNIQRGRDHGLPSYLDVRKKCGLDAVKPTTFSDLKDLPVNNQGRGFWETFEQLYETVDDIDLYAGGIAELNAPGARVGPTFACVIALQFRNLKFGDRFYYENNHADGFTEDGLREIKKFSLSRLLCDTMEVTEGELHIQPQAMLLEEDANTDQPITFRNGESNARVACSDTTKIPDIDYSKFLPAPPTPAPTPRPTRAPRPPRPKGGK